MVAPVEEPYRINQRIRPEVWLIVEDEAGEEQNLGVMPTAQAMRMAEERELDLVEVAPQAQPRLQDHGLRALQVLHGAQGPGGQAGGAAPAGRRPR